MSDKKKWYEGEQGIYSKVPKRGPLAGKEVYYARVEEVRTRAESPG